MTRQNQPVFSYAPIYKYWCDITMTHVRDIQTIRIARTDQKTTMTTLNDKKDPQKQRYDSNRFGPYSLNSHFVTVTVTHKNR